MGFLSVVITIVKLTVIILSDSVLKTWIPSLQVLELTHDTAVEVVQRPQSMLTRRKHGIIHATMGMELVVHVLTELAGVWTDRLRISC